MAAPEPSYADHAMCNGVLVAAAALRVSPPGGGFMSGEGVFETVRVWQGRPVGLDAHHARLAAALDFLGAPPAAACEVWRDRAAAVLAANALTEGSLKIVVFQDAAGWSELMLVRAHVYPASSYTAGFRLRSVAGDRRVDPRPALKSLARLGHDQAKRAARAAGFDEALWVDPQGWVLEGATTNVFAIRAGEVCTPPLARGILPGVMRARVLRLPGPWRLREGDLSLDALRQADEVFVTNALLGIMPVAQVDAMRYDLGRNPVTRALRAALAECEAE